MDNKLLAVPPFVTTIKPFRYKHLYCRIWRRALMEGRDIRRKQEKRS
jgi:hypothetical protein